jgi:hypothetical protein
MTPQLTEALVAPRLDDLRRSARMARTAPRQTERPGSPLPGWTRMLGAPALAAEPIASGCTGDAA